MMAPAKPISPFDNQYQLKAEFRYDTRYPPVHTLGCAFLAQYEDALFAVSPQALMRLFACAHDETKCVYTPKVAQCVARLLEMVLARPTSRRTHHAITLLRSLMLPGAYETWFPIPSSVSEDDKNFWRWARNARALQLQELGVPIVPHVVRLGDILARSSHSGERMAARDLAAAVSEWMRLTTPAQGQYHQVWGAWAKHASSKYWIDALAAGINGNNVGLAMQGFVLMGDGYTGLWRAISAAARSDFQVMSTLSDWFGQKQQAIDSPDHRKRRAAVRFWEHFARHIADAPKNDACALIEMLAVAQAEASDVPAANEQAPWRLIPAVQQALEKRLNEVPDACARNALKALGGSLDRDSTENLAEKNSCLAAA